MNEKKSYCYSPFFEMTIFADGKVAPCCFLDQERLDEVDNLEDKTVREVWEGKRFEIFRLRVLTNIVSNICKNCTSRKCDYQRT